MNSRLYVDAGEPAPDIIEALQELLSLPGYPSSQKRSQPLGDSSTENQHTPYPETNSRTSPQRFQRLDPSEVLHLLLLAVH